MSHQLPAQRGPKNLAPNLGRSVCRLKGVALVHLVQILCLVEVKMHEHI